MTVFVTKWPDTNTTNALPASHEGERFG